MSRPDADFTPTAAQERVADRIRHEIPGVVLDCRPCVGGRALSIHFEYTDPRPSRNGLVSDSVIGWVIIGSRGAVRSFWGSRLEPFSSTYQARGGGWRVRWRFESMLSSLGRRHRFIV